MKLDTKILKASAPASRRRFTVGVSPARFRAAASVDTLHVWHPIYEQPTLSSTAAQETQPWTSTAQWLGWPTWHVPDTSIETRFAALRGAFLASDDTPRQRHPTESEEDVVADRSEDDPLPPEKHQKIELPAGEAEPRPTESEEDVRADRETDDPLPPSKHHAK